MSQTPKFIPILMSTPMVNSLQNGYKDVTRRKVREEQEYRDPSYYLNNCPYGKIGDILWVRECAYYHVQEKRWFYKADDILTDSITHGYKWKPSIHMPKAACRFFLQITKLTIERLGNISFSDEECVREGIELLPLSAGGEMLTTNLYRDYSIGDNDIQVKGLDPLESFQSLWRSINGEWEPATKVYRIEFNRIDKPSNF